MKSFATHRHAPYGGVVMRMSPVFFWYVFIGQDPGHSCA
jgi:hypothetical protein